MQQLTYSVMTSVATFLAIFIVQAAMSIFTADRGWFVIDPKVNLDGSNYLIMDIYNNSSEGIDSLREILPIAGNLERVRSSIPLDLIILSTADNESLLDISSISPAALTRIVLSPVDTSSFEAKVINAKEKGLGYEDSENLRSVLRREFALHTSYLD